MCIADFVCATAKDVRNITCKGSLFLWLPAGTNVVNIKTGLDYIFAVPENVKVNITNTKARNLKMDKDIDYTVDDNSKFEDVIEFPSGTGLSSESQAVVDNAMEKFVAEENAQLQTAIDNAIKAIARRDAKKAVKGSETDTNDAKVSVSDEREADATPDATIPMSEESESDKEAEILLTAADTKGTIEAGVGSA